jgi:predicted transcriptional regulator
MDRDVLVVPLRRRSQFEIMAEILSLCKQPQTRTRVSMETCLSWKTSDRYLSYLLDQKFLETDNSSIEYVTAEKGFEFLSRWTQLVRILPEARAA